MEEQTKGLRVARSLLNPLPEAAMKLSAMSQKQRVLRKKKGRKNRPDGRKTKQAWIRKPENKMSKKQRLAKRALEIAILSQHSSKRGSCRRLSCASVARLLAVNA